jgi:hypothetical protein
MGPIRMPDVLMRVFLRRARTVRPGVTAQEMAARWYPGRTYRGDNRGLLITRIRTADGVECRGNDLFGWADFVKPNVSLVN